MSRGVFILALLLGSASIAFGQLTFPETAAERNADPADETVEIQFPFTNDQKLPVEIVKIDTSCGCLKATSDKELVLPGESGVITGVFSVVARPGVSDKALTIHSEMQGTSRQQNLRVKVTVPVIIELEPKINVWYVGEDPKPKEYLFEVKREKPINITEVSTSREGFECEVVEVEKGRKYRLIVTPPETETPTMGIVRVETDCEIPAYQRRLLFFSVKKQPTVSGR